MHKLLLVAKHDVKMTLRQRSFWILTLIMPVILMATNTAGFMSDRSDEGGALAGLQGLDEGPTAFGLVDQAGLIDQVPAELESLVVRYDGVEAARAGLAAGTIDEYAVLPADYVATGQIDVYGEEVQVLGGGGSTAGNVVPYLVALNLTGDQAVAAALNNPTPGGLAERHDLAPTTQGEGSNRALAGMVAQILPMMYYFLLVMGSNYLMRSVVAEKENRTVEMLLLSVEPRQMMVGKILAASVVTAIQVVVWVGGGVLLVSRGAQVMNVAGYAFPAGFIVWAVLFLVLGFLLFASVMAAGGAMANSAREGGQMTILLIVPQMPTLMFAQTFLDEPHGLLAVVLSLFPFSAPSAMV
ncbi:MAG TPA: ABC transporter permease, partial [Anaerolineae bacterium]|nr:ABC transporter permease [Anaerolineae bacterium]